MVDCIVTSAGGVEEDFIKCLKPTFIGRLLKPRITLPNTAFRRFQFVRKRVAEERPESRRKFTDPEL